MEDTDDFTAFVSHRDSFLWFGQHLLEAHRHHSHIFAVLKVLHFSVHMHLDRLMQGIANGLQCILGSGLCLYVDQIDIRPANGRQHFPNQAHFPARLLTISSTESSFQNMQCAVPLRTARLSLPNVRRDTDQIWCLHCTIIFTTCDALHVAHDMICIPHIAPWTVMHERGVHSCDA